MKKPANIKKSIRSGEYVGYNCEGRWRITRTLSEHGNWYACLCDGGYSDDIVYGVDIEHIGILIRGREKRIKLGWIPGT